jgi:hypothetical protein
MKAEANKYYKLNSSYSYFCVTIQRYVKFLGLVVVKAENAGILDPTHYGYLVDTSNPGGPDYESELCEIEFKDEDILNEYQLKDMPLFYMDFPYIEKNQ